MEKVFGFLFYVLLGSVCGYMFADGFLPSHSANAQVNVAFKEECETVKQNLSNMTPEEHLSYVRRHENIIENCQNLWVRK